MINPNELDEHDISTQVENENKEENVLEIPFPEDLAKLIDKLIKKSQVSYDILINKLLYNHFLEIQSELMVGKYDLLRSHYFCIDEIFNGFKNENNDSSNKSEKKFKQIPVKINQRYLSIIKAICQETYLELEFCISKAIQIEWQKIGTHIEAGYHDIIDDFWNVSKIKQALDEVLNDKDKEHILKRINK